MFFRLFQLPKKLEKFRIWKRYKEENRMSMLGGESLCIMNSYSVEILHTINHAVFTQVNHEKSTK